MGSNPIRRTILERLMQKPKVSVKNLVWAILFQVTQKDFVREWKTGNVKGIFHINSHIAQKTKTPKVAYGHYVIALHAAIKMEEKQK